ncbi:MAG TPA: HPr(Ser) kinase/phosphatase [Gemmatimonadaceae bacterium]|jgi:HPr kinase/phosphorylase|nr:HPr(Ser) kinase/phosphatase [Gemmatimonadaceae bacterium]
MKKPRFTVGRFLELLRESLQLEQLGPPDGLEREIVSSDVSSPGLVLAGYTERFPSNRIQIFGETEISYLGSLPAEQRSRVLGLFFSFPVPCAIVTKGLELPDEFVAAASRAGVPVLRSALKTAEFYSRVKPVLAEEFAPTTTLHGSLADVYGVGLLFVGQSGIGKSECVLDLVERGHRLVADDLVIAHRRGNDVIIGRGHELQRHHMEIRGVGVIDVKAVFGIRAVRQQKRIEVVVALQEWDKTATVDRTGLDMQTITILDVEIPKVVIPLNPGKNITVVAEVVAMNHLLRYSGVDPAEAFNQTLIDRMRASSDLRQYLAEDNE